jgi:hypothetical protein
MKPEADIPFLRQLRSEILDAPGNPRTHRGLPTGLILSAVIVAVAIGAWAVWPTQEADRTGPLALIPRYGVSVAHPLVDGASVTVREAVARLRSCEACPRIQDMDHVVAAYIDGSGGVAFVFNDGTWVVLTPDARSSEQYIADMKPIYDSTEWPFDLIEFNGTRIVATDTSKNGPAAMLWVQGGYLWEVIGQGGSGLSEIESVLSRMM